MSASSCGLASLPRVDDVVEQAVASCLGPVARPPLRLVWVSGWEMDGTRLTALALAGDARVPSAVAKVGVGRGRAVVLREAENLRRLAARAEASLACSVPRVIGGAESEEIAVVIEEPLRGRPATLPAGERATLDLVLRAEAWLCELRRVPPEEPGPGCAHEVTRIAQAYLATFSPGPAERRLVESTASRARELEGLPIGMPIEHGDLCLANLLTGPSGLEVLDWEEPLRAALPGADLVHLLASLADDLDRAGRLHPPPLRRSRLQGRVASAFLGEEWFPRLARAALARHWDALQVPSHARRVLFTAEWLKYALGKAERSMAKTPRGTRPGRGPAPWGLVEFGGGGCLDVAELAAREDELRLG